MQIADYTVDLYQKDDFLSNTPPSNQIVLKPDPDNTNTTVTMELPVGAKASGTCK